MSQRVDQAEQRFLDGWNCAQAIVSVYAPAFGIEEETALRMTAPLDGGLGCRGHVCGAVNGACLVLGLTYGHTQPGPTEEKQATIDITREFLKRFEEKHGRVNCRGLLRVNIGNPEGMQRAVEDDLFTQRCPGFVRTACEIIEELLYEQQSTTEAGNDQATDVGGGKRKDTRDFR